MKRYMIVRASKIKKMILDAKKSEYPDCITTYLLIIWSNRIFGFCIYKKAKYATNEQQKLLSEAERD